jgi:hypothetical protein
MITVLTGLIVIFDLTIAAVYRKHPYNIFFFLLASNNILGIFLWYAFSLSGQTIWIPICYLLMLSTNMKLSLQWKWVAFIGFIIVLILNYFSNTTIQHYVALLTNIVLFFTFFKLFVKKIFSNSEINFFFLILVLSETIMIINFIAIIKEVEIGIYIYHAGMIFQLLLKILLVILYKNPSFKLKTDQINR